MFLFEVINLRQDNKNGNVRAFTNKVYLKVPLDRMNQELRRINRLGGKIISVQPLSSDFTYDQAQINKLPWWVEITTTEPKCIYYFGPFDSHEEAKTHQNGYIEDLESELAVGITVKIKQCQPTNLTIF